jgi:site-specific DNA-methyltransferase (adenine-specific)
MDLYKKNLIFGAFHFLDACWRTSKIIFEYIMENIITFNTDCLGNDGLCTIDEKSIDMILCDPPFGITANPWDTVLDLNKLFIEYDRIIKDNGAVVMFGNQPFTTDLINAYRKRFKYSLVWEKGQGTDFMKCKVKPLKAHEDILVFYKTKPTYNPQMSIGKPYKHNGGRKGYISSMGKTFNDVVLKKDNEGTRFPKTVLKFNKEQGKHTTQKPVRLCEWLVKTYTNEGDTVLDNTMGSGTTGVACVNTGRKFIGYELDKNYYDIAEQRLYDALSAIESP